MVSETSHLRQNGLPEDIIEAPQDVAAAEDFSIEPASHVTNAGGDQGGGDGGLGGGERFFPQETHKDDNKGGCGVSRLIKGYELLVSLNCCVLFRSLSITYPVHKLLNSKSYQLHFITLSSTTIRTSLPIF